MGPTGIDRIKRVDSQASGVFTLSKLMQKTIDDCKVVSLISKAEEDIGYRKVA